MKKRMKPQIRPVGVPRMTPPFFVKYLVRSDHIPSAWWLYGRYKRFGYATRAAKKLVAIVRDALVEDSAGNTVWRANPASVRNRRHGKKGGA